MTEQSRSLVTKLCWWAGGLTFVWLILWVVARPRWVEVRNSNAEVATNVKLEVWTRGGGKLVARRECARLAPGQKLIVRHWCDGVDAKMWYTLSFGPANYHERSVCGEHGEGWRFDIQPQGTINSWYVNNPHMSVWHGYEIRE